MKKSIAILTVHKGINIGSFLQAYALSRTLSEMGNEVVMLDNESRKPKRMMLSTIKNKLLKGNVKGALFSYKLFSKFISSQKQFEEQWLENADSFDYVVLGSDEIWNVNRDVIKAYPSFFGVGINTKKIAYAPSINNADFEDMNVDYIKNSLNDISHISVRDRHSKEVVEALTGKEVTVVCDPTWLLTAEQYPVTKKFSNDKKYIFVYMYNSSITQEEIDKMTSLAKSKGLELISVNNPLDWCDKVITATPFEFLDILNGAQFVFTNTFHGTIFSILFNKPFASFEKNNRKIAEILDYTGLSGRKLCDGAADIERLYNEKISWDEINERVNLLREHSYNYLNSSLSND